MNKLELALVFHHHQPSGNLPEMFEKAFREAYEPFVDALERHPGVRVTLHYSGALLDDIRERRPAFLEKLRALQARGQVELLGGAMYEPILAAIPDRDKLGQIRYNAEVLEEMFGVRPRGVWLAERVWEPHFPAILEAAGVKYTLLDDTQFEAIGYAPGDLLGSYLTEEEGRAVEVFPMNTELRPLLPFEPPQRFLEALRKLMPTAPETPETPLPLVVIGEDGEKFGLWEGTAQICYEGGWLDRFFEALEKATDWLSTTTLEARVKTARPLSHAYLPSGAYAEMGEWSLPLEAAAAFRAARERGVPVPRLAGGHWRNFLVKYPEVGAMQKRMAYVSRKLHNTPRAPQQAYVHLYRAQAGDAYWHAHHGGAYHNFLRFSVYRNLIEAENAVEPRKYSWLEIEYVDIDADGSEEVVVESNTMNLHFKPRSGGTLTEWDFRPRAVNLTDSFTRRREPYHAGTDLLLDHYLRRSLIDHFVGGEVSLQQFAQGDYLELGDFVHGDFEAGKYRNRVTLRRVGTVRGPAGVPVEVELKKSVRVLPKENRLEIEYKITNHGDWDIITRFGSEWNFGLLAAHAPDRYYAVGGRRVADLGSTFETRDVAQASLVDEWLGLEVSFEFEGREALLWNHPVETLVPGAPGGALEAVYQSSVTMPLWDLDLPKRRSRRLAYSVVVRER
ncbi:alpha-amylase [Deinobacterium chartae]|uniref:Alpha-amylase n=1 Tax=Deinobacterium chartae TaxID=521158 RepID=A0A841I1X8_9DEIO|nr:alpha-amylase/4-alpha-glucanotransferase domain-containing protein [Deinobacterium chartae]MBB6098420.1 alpha-amylase [Deinobacterium chartae]